MHSLRKRLFESSWAIAVAGVVLMAIGFHRGDAGISMSFTGFCIFLAGAAGLFLHICLPAEGSAKNAERRK